MLKTLKCPKCEDTDLSRIAIRLVDVDQCPKCEGVWFDNFSPELLDILKTGKDQLPEQLKKSLEGDAGKMTPAPSNDYLCPRCGTKMGTHWYAAEVNKTFEIESCPRGCGIWLDDGELGKAFEFYERVNRTGTKMAGILGRIGALKDAEQAE